MRTPLDLLRTIPLIDSGEAEKADFVVCARVDPQHPPRFADSLFSTCTDCSHTISFRPYMPKKPKKICLECMATRAGFRE